MGLLFTNPQFRLLWANGLLANLGAVFFVMVGGWLTLTITDSPFWVGAAIGMGGAGLMLASPVGGVLADSLPRRELIGASGAAISLTVLALAVLVLADQVRLWHILAASFFFGAAGGLRASAFVALTLDVVGRASALRANAANFVAMSAGGIAAPLVAGAVVSAWDIGWALVIVVASNLVGAAMVMSMSGQPGQVREPAETVEESPRRQAPWRAFYVGARYVFGTANVRALILMGLVGEGFGWAHITMLPVMARDVLDAGVAGFGYLQSAGFAGFLASTLVVSGLGDVQRKGRLMVVGAGGFGLLILLFASSPVFTLSLVLLSAAYALGAIYEVTLTTLVQTVVPDRMRGRVISFQAFTWGFAAFSGFHMGGIASLLGAPLAIAVGAGIMLANTLRLAPWAWRLGEPGPGVQEGI